MLQQPLDLEAEFSYVLLSGYELLVTGCGKEGHTVLVNFSGAVEYLPPLPVSRSGLCYRSLTNEVFALGGLEYGLPIRKAAVLKLSSQPWQPLPGLHLKRGRPCAASLSSGIFVCDSVCPTPELYSYLTQSFTLLPLLEPLSARTVLNRGSTLLCVTDFGDLVVIEGLRRRVSALSGWVNGMHCYLVGSDLFLLKYPLQVTMSLSKLLD